MLILSFLTLVLFCVFVTLYVLAELNIAYWVIAFLIFLIEIIIICIIFAQLTNFYPLNSVDSKTYAKLSHKHLTSKNPELNLYENEDGIWRIDDEFFFDMRGYVFPKIYICSYFIRNIHYPIINNKKLRLSALFKSQNTDKFEEFKIIFRSRNKIKECFIVKNGKTKTFPLRGFLIYCRFYLDAFDRYNKQAASRVEINEDYYNSLKK